MNNLQNGNENLNNEFEYAYDLNNKKFSHEELCQMLCFGNIAQRQLSALNFDYIKTKEDVSLLLSTLTGCDGKIREAVAYKINHFIVHEPSTRSFFADLASQKFSDATIDINANICRLIVDSALLLKDYSKFSKSYTHRIIDFSEEALEELSKFIFKDKKYVINKQLFKLYWCLEALNYFYCYADEKILEQILNQCSNISEYTIREKVAKICVNSDKFEHIKRKLINDKNYYVKQIFIS